MARSSYGEVPESRTRRCVLACVTARERAAGDLSGSLSGQGNLCRARLANEFASERLARSKNVRRMRPRLPLAVRGPGGRPTTKQQRPAARFRWSRRRTLRRRSGVPECARRLPRPVRREHPRASFLFDTVQAIVQCENRRQIGSREYQCHVVTSFRKAIALAMPSPLCGALTCASASSRVAGPRAGRRK